MEKVDLVMWAKNGAKTLPTVLKRIQEVIDNKVVRERIIVDDGSTDSTRNIAESFGWVVIQNEGKGIGDGANTALRNVKSDYFVSFEQDLVLARDWWQKIPRHLLDPKVVIASGVRLPNKPLALRKLQEYAMESYEKNEKAGGFFPLARSLDNTIYKTEIIRKLGGFPRLSVSAGVDHLLAQRIYQNGFVWKVDYDVKSIHLRKGLKEELSHYYWYGIDADKLEQTLFRRNASARQAALRFFFSPLRGLQIGLEKNTPQAIYIYPLLRLAFLRGVFDGRRRAI